MDFERYLREFEMAIATPGLSPELKLYEMKFWWVGTPGILVSRYLLREDHEIALKEAIAELKAKFGKRRTSAEEMLEDLLSGGKIPSKDIEAVDEFVEKIQTVYQTAIETDRDKDFDKRSIYESILKVKLPHFRYKWLQKWAKNEEDGGSQLSFSDFISYLNLSRRLSETLNRFDLDKNDRAEAKPTTGRNESGNFSSSSRGGFTSPFQSSSSTSSSRFNNSRNGAPTRVSSARAAVQPPHKSSYEIKNMNNIQSVNDIEASYPRYCLLCEKPHNLSSCPSYKSASVDERSTLCRNKNICFKCLGTGHRAVTCASSNLCLKCGGVHHTSLHGSTPVTPTNKSATPFVPHVTTFAVKTAPAAPTAPIDTA